jgi:DUF1009 family protein
MRIGILVTDAFAVFGMPVHVYGFQGYTDPGLEREAHEFALLPLGKLSKIIKVFKKAGVKRLCMAGAIDKPRALHFRPDWRTARVLLRTLGQGDDALLRAFAQEIESEGFEVMQAALLVPGLAAPQGVLTRRHPTAIEWENICYGWSIARTIGRLDIGQCIVVRRTMVMAVECLEGTDEALRRGAALGGKGCVAIKILKPGQDKRLDQPAIGLTTIEVLADNGFTCLAYEAEGALMFDREACIALANEHDLCLIGLNHEAELKRPE